MSVKLSKPKHILPQMEIWKLDDEGIPKSMEQSMKAKFQNMPPDVGAWNNIKTGLLGAFDELSGWAEDSRV